MRDLRDPKPLALVVLTPELARAALEDRAKLGRMLGSRVPETWPGADSQRAPMLLDRTQGKRTTLQYTLPCATL